MGKYKREPTGNTCPDINSVISGIIDSMKICKSVDERNTKEELLNFFDSIHDNLYYLEDTLESLRSANLSLREWGTTEAGRVDELEGEIEDLGYSISTLEERCRDLENENYELQSN